mmetsp:Transcript_13188/g.46135  ORF Transcript_13188/g.46135 Transcript_13188/m.46135 type:complete len:299 (+) Transcript_13188:3487-4383(+)
MATIRRLHLCGAARLPRQPPAITVPTEHGLDFRGTVVVDTKLLDSPAITLATIQTLHLSCALVSRFHHLPGRPAARQRLHLLCGTLALLLLAQRTNTLPRSAATRRALNAQRSGLPSALFRAFGTNAGNTCARRLAATDALNVDGSVALAPQPLHTSAIAETAPSCLNLGCSALSAPPLAGKLLPRDVAAPAALHVGGGCDAIDDVDDTPPTNEATNQALQLHRLHVDGRFQRLVALDATDKPLALGRNCIGASHLVPTPVGLHNHGGRVHVDKVGELRHPLAFDAAAHHALDLSRRR